MSESTTGSTARPAAGQSAADRLAGDLADVAREEMQTVRTEFVEAARPAASGVILLGAAAGCAVLGIGAASATVLRILESFLPRKLAVAGLTAGYFTGAAVLGTVGLQQLREAGGSSQRLAEEIQEAVSGTVSRIRQAGAAAARDVHNG
ncbi:phage holin family protein [Pseudosporangium ferrugineum]|uniref:Putative superfamily III holin-X n=1 Tax=Pseudosporangium ferrugineum TaxID=439699 RepID=A0A2T0RG65_9ACTN|nr:phage holin family protein [Pseudosporangium ferrugineum]PRY20196.1 putative superfamily III holin-X [Pseudosporangium ferrugineum]